MRNHNDSNGNGNYKNHRPDTPEHRNVTAAKCFLDSVVPRATASSLLIPRGTANKLSKRVNQLGTERNKYLRGTFPFQTRGIATLITLYCTSITLAKLSFKASLAILLHELLTFLVHAFDCRKIVAVRAGTGNGFRIYRRREECFHLALRRRRGDPSLPLIIIWDIHSAGRCHSRDGTQGL